MYIARWQYSLESHRLFVSLAPLLPPPRAKYLGRNMLLLFLARQIYPAVPLDVHCEFRILECVHTWLLQQVRIHHALAQGSFNVKSESQVLCAPFVRLFGAADVAIPCPARPRCFTECCDLGALAEKLLASWILPYHVRGVVEVCGFRVGREDIAEEEVCHTTLGMLVWCLCQVYTGPTVAMTPMATTTKLNDCCVVRTTFSPGDKAFQCTRPVSPVKVMDLRGGSGIGLPGKLGVACALREAEKAARATRRADDGWTRGSRSDDRSSEMASVGL